MIINTTVIFFGSTKVKGGSKICTDNTVFISIAYHHVHFLYPTLPLVCCLMSATDVQHVCQFLKNFSNLVTTCTNFKLCEFCCSFENLCLGASTHSNTFVCSVQLFHIYIWSNLISCWRRIRYVYASPIKEGWILSVVANTNSEMLIFFLWTARSFD